MSHTSHHHQTRELQADRYGLRVAALLEQGAAALPHDIGERLRVARQQAVQHRRRAAVAAAVPALEVQRQAGHAAALGKGPFEGSWWTALGVGLPAMALVLGLLGIYQFQNDSVARETADIDAELLLDELPPEAYADPGFAQFLKTQMEVAP